MGFLGRFSCLISVTLLQQMKLLFLALVIFDGSQRQNRVASCLLVGCGWKDMTVKDPRVNDRNVSSI